MCCFCAVVENDEDTELPHRVRIGGRHRKVSCSALYEELLRPQTHKGKSGLKLMLFEEGGKRRSSGGRGQVDGWLSQHIAQMGRHVLLGHVILSREQWRAAALALKLELEMAQV